MFRNAVFKRDKFQCRMCGLKQNNSQKFENYFDAHHIVNRNDMPNGGYVVENGITLCHDCHEKAEFWLCNNYGEPLYDAKSLYVVITSSYEKAFLASKKLK